jgi:peptidyl-prolyl cis-trans isomerase SurA
MTSRTSPRKFFAALLLLISLSGISRAQDVAAFVNGEPITTYDVDQRIRMMQVLARQNLNRSQALEQLIEDRLKTIEARRVGYRIKDDNLDDRISSIAANNGKTTHEFLSELSRAGIETRAYKTKILADLSWELALRQRFKSDSAAGSQEVSQMFDEKVRSGAAKVTDYTVRNIIFVVPRSGEGVGQRQRDAQAARASFQSCDEGVEALRKMRDVAIRAPVKRSSDQIPAPLAKVLNDTPIGRLTPPFQTTQGIELYAVCGKEERVDETSLRNQIENDVATKKRTAASEGYLKSLRDKAVVQYRR